MIRNQISILWVLIASTLLYCVPAPAQKPVLLPELSSKRLLNDLHVTVASTPRLGDSMTIGLVLRYGAAFDPADKSGLSNLVSRMFLRATAGKTSKGYSG